MKARQILKRDKQPRPVLVCCFARFAADKLPLETEPIACDNNTILTLKPGDQTLSRLMHQSIPAVPNAHPPPPLRATAGHLLTL